MLKYVGTIDLKDKVDITDPCYNKDVWCRLKADCKPGEYSCYVDIDNEVRHPRVACVSIFKENKICELEEMEEIGTIGVDSGLAGFFNDKKDFSRQEWFEFCDKIFFDEKGKNAWISAGGFFSSTGYGDGAYTAYASKDRDAFTIVFIDYWNNFEDEFEDELDY